MKKNKLVLSTLLCGCFLLIGVGNKTASAAYAETEYAWFNPCNGESIERYEIGGEIYDISWSTFNFVGWYDQPTGGNLIYWDSESQGDFTNFVAGETYYAHWSNPWDDEKQIVSETIYLNEYIDYSKQPYLDIGLECEFNAEKDFLTVYMTDKAAYRRIEVTCDALFTVKDDSADVYVGSVLIGDGLNECDVTIAGTKECTLNFKALKLYENPYRPFAVRAKASLNLDDYAIISDSYFATDNVNNCFGGAINVQRNGTFNLCGGLIENCSAAYGGAVYVSGIFNQTAGKISNCSAFSSTDNADITGRGGAVYVAEYGEYNFSGGEIFECNSGIAGGAIYAYKNVNISGEAKISDCYAYSYGEPKTKGGAIYMLNGKLTMTGGEISGNHTGYRGGGIYLGEYSTAIITGGKITNNLIYDQATQDDSLFAGAGIFDRGNLTVGGDAYISGNTIANKPRNNLYVDDGVKIIVTEPGDNFEVFISLYDETAVLSEGVETDYSSSLYCDNAYKYVVLNDKDEYIFKDKVTIDTCGGSEAEFFPFDGYISSPEKDGWIFTGWYTAKTGGDLIVDADYEYGEKYETLPYGITYYAHYVKSQNEVSVVMDSYTYGGTVPTPSIDGELEGDPNFSYYVSGGSLIGSVKWENITPTTLNAGNYKMRAVIDATEECLQETTDWTDFEVIPAELTVTAKNKTISWGEEYEYEDGDVSIEGFVAGETIENLSGTLSCSTSYEEGCSGGTYELTPYGLESDNYTINYVDGVLTVSKVENEIVEFNVYNWKAGERALWPDAYSKYGDVEFMFSKNVDQKSFDEDIPTEPGNYVCKAYVVGNDSYGSCMEEKEFTIYKSSENKPVDENNNVIEDPKVTIVDSQNGLDPNAVLLVKVVASNDANVNGEVKEDLEKANFFNADSEDIFGIYDAKLLIDGVETQPNGNIKIKMYIPDELVGKEFNLYHIHKESNGNKTVISIEYEVEDKCLTFVTDKLSYFAFVGDKAGTVEEPCFMHFILIAIAAVIITFNGLWYFFVVNRHNDNEKNTIEKAMTIAVNAVCVALTIVFGIIGILVGCDACIAFLIINILLAGGGATLNMLLKANK